MEQKPTAENQNSETKNDNDSKTTPKKTENEKKPESLRTTSPSGVIQEFTQDEINLFKDILQDYS